MLKQAKKKMKGSFERTISEELFQNANTFLKDGIERLVLKDSDQNGRISNDLLILTCTSFQIALELALKCIIIKKSGLKTILETKHNNLTDDEIERGILSNRISIRSFEELKNYSKTHDLITEFSKKEYEYIDEFQLYRNKMVHFKCHVGDDALSEFKYKIVLYMIHCIFRIIINCEKSDYRPSEFVEYSLGARVHKKLLNYKPYIDCMSEIAEDQGGDLYTCIHCENRTFLNTEKYCYCCNFEYQMHELIECDFCKAIDSVIYDGLNIHLNNHMTNGLCLNCGEKTTVYRCPKCDKTYSIETNFDSKLCFDGRCMYE